MVFKIAWMYYDLLELYGDSGNIKVIENILIYNEIDYTVDKITVNENCNLQDYDLVFLGGGSDFSQSIIYKDLLKYKNQMENVLKNHGFILTICGGYQLFGKYYIGTNGETIAGLGLFDFYTVAGEERCVGNIVAECTLNDNHLKIVGFENHGGQTKNVKTPFAKIIKGNGNETKSKYEGFMEKNFIGTYIHGPLLPKNPEIVKYILEYVFEKKYQINKKVKIDNIEFYKDAKKIILERG